ncbi:hypothetical protein [Bacterioplanoides sp.]|uniref:hypothetical protein n=1 Tax=Bacterioplanoides sp. TaxID=2066072 RepID=UPI003B5A065C
MEYVCLIWLVINISVLAYIVIRDEISLFLKKYFLLLTSFGAMAFIGWALVNNNGQSLLGNTLFSLGLSGIIFNIILDAVSYRRAQSAQRKQQNNMRVLLNHFVAPLLFDIRRAYPSPNLVSDKHLSLAEAVEIRNQLHELSFRLRRKQVDSIILTPEENQLMTITGGFLKLLKSKEHLLGINLTLASIISEECYIQWNELLTKSSTLLEIYRRKEKSGEEIDDWEVNQTREWLNIVIRILEPFPSN